MITVLECSKAPTLKTNHIKRVLTMEQGPQETLPKMIVTKVTEKNYIEEFDWPSK